MATGGKPIAVYAALVANMAIAVTEFLAAVDLPAVIERIEASIRAEHQEVRRIFIEARALSAVAQRGVEHGH